jgi:hypothetical protein
MVSQLNTLLFNTMFAFVLNMVFNLVMDTKLATVEEDRRLIDHLGGPSKLAELLGYAKERGGVQRVHNWKERGIPPAVKLTRPDLFLRGLSQEAA